MSKKQSTATKRAAAERAAERAAAIRRENEAKERRRRTITVGAVVLGVVAVIVAIAVAVQSARDTAGGGEGQVSGAPSGVVNEYAIPSGPADAPVTVEVFEDFMCPACGEFEAMSGDVLHEYAESGEARVLYRPISFLDQMSNGTRYSTRAMNAVGVVLDEAGPEVAVDFHDALFANQPAEGTDGLSNEQLIDLAVEAGADREAITEPIENLKFEEWVADATEASSQEGVTGTPTVLVNGEQLQDWSPESVRSAIEDAAAAE